MVKPSAPNPTAAVIEAIAASPTPFHAANEMSSRLGAAGFAVADGPATADPAAEKGVLTHGGAAVAWVAGPGPIDRFVIVGCHTDSPNLRLRPKPDITAAGVNQIGVETYGGLLDNSWLNRDLGVAGRVIHHDGSVELLRIDDPVAVIPQLAIHLDRDIRTDGLKLNPQTHLAPIWALASDVAAASAVAPNESRGDTGPDVVHWLLGHAGVDPASVAASDLMLFDVMAPAIVGGDRNLLASARIDNQVACFTAVEALAPLGADDLAPGTAAVLVANDHEEIGSNSYAGAAGQLLPRLLERLCSARGADRSSFLATLDRSIALSNDGAHATHPNYADRHDASHNVCLNGGMTMKHNSNQRYATDATSAAWLRGVATDAGLELQSYSHRNDLPCGSTIGPITATLLGIPTVDVGVPQLSMHSIRELCGLDDVADAITLTDAAWRSGQR